MKKIFTLSIIGVMLLLTACQKEVLFIRKTFVDRTITLNGVQDPIANTKWLQEKYLIFQEDPTTVKSRALLVVEEYGTGMPRVFEYTKEMKGTTMVQRASMYAQDGSVYKPDGENSTSLLSEKTIAHVDSLVKSKIIIVDFNENPKKVMANPAFTRSEDVVVAIDTILNSSKVKVLSCFLLEDIPGAGE